MTEYAVLFAWSFLPATILPLDRSSRSRRSCSAADELLFVVVATAGNSLGAFTTYWLGRKAAALAEHRAAIIRRAHRAAELLSRYGQPAVFFSWVPLVGDAMVAAAGAARMPVLPFASWRRDSCASSFFC